jgi:hypothetical protein
MVTRSSDNWQTRSGSWDALKTRFITFDDYPVCGSRIKIEPETNTVKCVNIPEINSNSLVDMFVDDYRLERYWNRIEYYADIFSRAKYVMTPDFSLLLGMPTEMIQWNIYRNRLIGYVYESLGIKVIPTVSWTDKSSFDYCTKGIRIGSTIAVSNIGARNDKQIALFNRGLQQCVYRIEPEQVIICSNKKYRHNYNDSIFYHIKPFWDKKRNHGKVDEERNGTTLKGISRPQER